MLSTIVIKPDVLNILSRKQEPAERVREVVAPQDTTDKPSRWQRFKNGVKKVIGFVAAGVVAVTPFIRAISRFRESSLYQRPQRYSRWMSWAG